MEAEHTSTEGPTMTRRGTELPLERNCGAKVGLAPLHEEDRLYAPGFPLNTNSTSLVSLAPTVTFCVAVPNLSCQASRV